MILLIKIGLSLVLAFLISSILLLTDNAPPVVVISLAAIAATVSIVTAILAYKIQKTAAEALRETRALAPAIQEVKVTVDGKMSELIEAQAKASNLEGAERERVEARAREAAEQTKTQLQP